MRITDLTDVQIEEARNIYWDKNLSWDKRMKLLMDLFGNFFPLY